MKERESETLGAGDRDEEQLLRSVALQNAESILQARLRAEHELVQARAQVELKTKELADSIALLSATLEATNDGILVTDESGRVKHCNDRYLELWGLSRGVIESATHRELVRELCAKFASSQRFAERIEEIYAIRPRETFDVLELADGRVFERNTRLQAVEGERRFRVWSFREITERLRTENALREETRVLSVLNETGTTLVSTLDLKDLLQSVTDAATKLSGAKFGAFFYNNTIGEQGNAYLLYTLSGAEKAAFEGLGQPRATPLFGPSFRGESPIRSDDIRADPRYGPMDPRHGLPLGHLPVRSYLAVHVVSRSGEVIGGLFFGHPEVGVFSERSERAIVGMAAQAAVAIDNARLFETLQEAATERKRLLESEQAARAHAERSNAIKDGFLATLSHELRTPLAAILGWTQVLRAQPPDSTSLRDGLERIERNARAQAQLIEDLLDMSRITAGKMRLDVQPLDLVAVVEAALETSLPAADAKGIRIEKLLDPAAGHVFGDPQRIQQVVWNLLSNAVKFTPQSGKVQVVLRRVSSHVELDVADTGVGIGSEFLPHVFERFRQADTSTTRAFGGLGLGLAIVKHLVELHGGTVRVTSAGEGRGATFTVALPLTVVRRPESDVSRHPSAGDAAVLSTTDLTGVKVLVVDDEADARELIRRILSHCGAEVLVAGSAEEALVLFEREQPHVLLSDVGMPRVDGYEFLRRVRALERGGRTPAIALTAFARAEDRTRALRSGYLVHLTKPIEPSVLTATVASVAGQARP